MMAPSTPSMRDRLVEVALDLIRSEGAAALTVRNITQRAGCSTTGIYTYFGGKHGLVEAIFVDGFESFDRAVGHGLDSGDFRTSGRAYRRWALDHPAQYMVMFGRAVPDYEPTPAAVDRALLSFLRLAAAVERAAPGSDAAERAYHYWATLHGYVMLDLANMGAPTPAESDALFERALDRLVAS